MGSKTRSRRSRTPENGGRSSRRSRSRSPVQKRSYKHHKDSLSSDNKRSRRSRSPRSPWSPTPERRTHSPSKSRSRSTTRSPRSPRRRRSRRSLSPDKDRKRRFGEQQQRYDRSRSTSHGERAARGRRGRRSSRSPLRRREMPEPCKILGVFGLSYATARRDLEREFGRFGRLSRVDLVLDPNGDSRGFGFVSFDSQRDADYAREVMSESIMNGKRIRVDYSTSRGPHPRTPGMYMGDNRAISRDYYRSRGRRSWSRESPRRHR